MDARAKKRLESEGKYHAEKRACSSAGIRPAQSSSGEPVDASTEPSSSSSSDHQTADLHMGESILAALSEGVSFDGSSNSDGGDEEDEIDPYLFDELNQRLCYSFRGGRGYGYSPSKEKMESVLSSLDGDVGSDALHAALTTLCEILSFGAEESLTAAAADSIASKLVKLAENESSPEIMLLAIRAMAYLCDVMPLSAVTLVNQGALPVLCTQLMSIEYMDVAEQGIQVLEKISRNQPVQCLRAGVIMASLSYIGFFSASIQRIAVSTAANVCESLPGECWSLIMEAVPALCSLLHYDDSKIVETSVVCLNRISAHFLSSPEALDAMCKHNLIGQCARLISSCSQPAVSQTMLIHLIRLLTRLASGSLLAYEELLQLNISSMLKSILEINDNYRIMSHSSLEKEHGNQVDEVLTLLTQLLPYSRAKGKEFEFFLAKERILAQEPKFLDQLVRDILPNLIKVVNSNVSPFVSYGCVSLIESMVSLSSLETLLASTKETIFSGLLAALLKRRDNHVLFSTLATAQLLLERHSTCFMGPFIKEGIVYAIDTLLQMPENFTPSSPISEKESVGNIITRNSKCFCHSFDPSSSSSSQSGSCTASREAVVDMAEKIKSTYFNNVTEDDRRGSLSILHRLKSLCSTMGENMKNNSTCECSAQNEEYLTHVLMEVMDIISGESLMSTFEFVESGVMRSLANYLSNGAYSQVEADQIDLHKHFFIVLKRFQNFSTICQSKSFENGREGLLMKLLVRKLQSSLSTFEDFSMVPSLNYHNRFGFADIPLRGYTVNPCLRIQFVCEDESAPRCHSDNVLVVESLSSFNEIEDFLFSRSSNRQSDLLEEYMSHGVGSFAEGIYLAAESSGEMAACQEYQKFKEAFISEQLKHSGTEETITRVRGTSSVSPVKRPDASPRLHFFLDGKQVDRCLSLYQTVLQHQLDGEGEVVVSPNFWTDLYKITYKKVEQTKKSVPTSWSSFTFDQPLLSWGRHPSFSCILDGNLPCSLEKSKPSYDALFLMKALESLNQLGHRMSSYETISAFAEGQVSSVEDLHLKASAIPMIDFLNSKLNEKLEEQMRDALSASTGLMPPWCGHLMASCPFLFSFETRWRYARLTELRQRDDSIYPRNIQRSHNGNAARTRFPVDRACILDSASKMMSSQAHWDSILEVEYLGEIGTGLGPTLEFYTLVCREFQKRGLTMWRGDYSSDMSQEDGDSGYVVASLGLFPRPWSTAGISSNGILFADVAQNFSLLGRIVAKALLDGRVLDLPFSKAFYKLMLEKELDVYDIQSFDPELGTTLLEFLALVHRKEYTGDDFLYRGSRIEDLCLDFSLPGYSDYALEFSDNGPQMVDVANLEEYVRLIVDATTGSGIARQVEAFKSGFNEVFPLEVMRIFSEDELERLLCGEQSSWASDELLHHVKFDHGYSSTSPPVIMLLEVIQEFSSDQRRAFLQFVTGAPRLPPGGLAALNPKLTVVRKHCTDNPDKELPSVMTCANYLKLPPFSSKETLRGRLLYAITEGQGSFHLS